MQTESLNFTRYDQPPMKKQLLTPSLLAAVILVSSAVSSRANYGAFGYGIELNASGGLATDSGLSLYALDNSGGSRLPPVGSAATLRTDWTSSSTKGSPTFSLGTFNPYEGGTLTLTGGSLLTYQHGDTVDTGSATLNYEIYQLGGSGTYTSFNLPFNEMNVAGSSGDTRFDTESQAINVLSGLAPGSYEISTYGNATADGGTGPIFESNGGNDFGATFMVVPEASTWVSLLAALGGLILLRGRRDLSHLS
jgi:hypothetical protein